jgi:hypothetical protein
MEITRLQPFPLVFSHDGFAAMTNYVIAIQDDHATDLVEISATSNATGVLVADLPNYFARYDDEYRVEVYEQTGTDVNGFAIRGDMVMIDTLTMQKRQRILLTQRCMRPLRERSSTPLLAASCTREKSLRL